MDHQQSDGPPSLHTPQHLIEGSSQQPSQEDPFPRPSYDPPDGAVRGRGLTGRGLPSLCYACFEQLPPEELVLGYCYHNYYQECVVVMVKAANEIDNLYPVRCCEIMIPLDWDTLQMPQQAVDKYNRRKREIEARGTTYCYRRACRAPIHPKFILHGVALCATCNGSTCVGCKKAVHEGLTCGEREIQEDERLHDLAVTYGWGKCSHCENYIQLSAGCNHLCKCPYKIHLVPRTDKEEGEQLLLTGTNQHVYAAPILAFHVAEHGRRATASSPIVTQLQMSLDEQCRHKSTAVDLIQYCTICAGVLADQCWSSMKTI